MYAKFWSLDMLLLHCERLSFLCELWDDISVISYF